MKNIGVVGLGDMGLPMAKNLLNDYSVKGYDMKQERVKEFTEAGGIACQNCAEVGEGSDIVFVIVMNGEQANDVIFGESGLISTLKEGSTIILSASIGLAAMTKIAEDMAAYNINLVDCPMTGGAVGAKAATLTLMAAGEEKVVNDCREVLNHIANNIYYVGAQKGLGQVVKSCIQGLVANTAIAASESMAVGIKSGLDGEMLANIIGTSIVGSSWLKIFTNSLLDRKFVDAGARITTLYKDVRMTLDLAHANHIPMFMTSQTYELFQGAYGKYPDEEVWSVAKLYETLADVKIERKLL